MKTDDKMHNVIFVSEQDGKLNFSESIYGPVIPNAKTIERDLFCHKSDAPLAIVITDKDQPNNLGECWVKKEDIGFENCGSFPNGTQFNEIVKTSKILQPLYRHF